MLKLDDGFSLREQVVELFAFFCVFGREEEEEKMTLRPLYNCC